MKILNPQIKTDIDNGSCIKLELGCGQNKRKGFYGADLLPLEGVDIVADLNQALVQLPDNCVDFIYSRHVLEHIQNLELLIQPLDFSFCTLSL